jgi:hypothetical protein
MGLSRKRQRELNRLKNQAENLWDDQKQVLEHANKVVRDARRQAAAFSREEISPRFRDGVAATRSVASSARDRLTDDVFPAVSSALGSALAVLEVAKNPQVREVLSRVSKAGTKVGTKVGIVQPKSSGPGRYILIGLGVVAAAAVAYAAWQTLRADDDLWIDDEPVSLDDDVQ